MNLEINKSDLQNKLFTQFQSIYHYLLNIKISIINNQMNEKQKQKQVSKHRYEKIKKVGEGSYGSVTKVFDHEAQAIRALKKIKFTAEDDGIPINAIRQISILKRIDHPNIVKIFDIHYNWEPTKLYILLEYVEENMYEHMKRNQPLSPYTIKSYAFQVLSALSYLHTLGIIHRDIKPQNLMITAQGIIKLCDFGQSRFTTMNKQDYSLDISTLWYRAPQILLGSNIYSFSVDIWAIGCVLAEMISGQPLFKSDCQIGQIFQIFKIAGTPKRQIFPKWKYLSTQFPNFEKGDLKISYADEVTMDLLSKMLQLDPSKRISSYQALKHKYFEGY